MIKITRRMIKYLVLKVNHSKRQMDFIKIIVFKRPLLTKVEDIQTFTDKVKVL